ncbi:MAG TPA: hypothetical protein VFE61_29225 [Candidatus Sulfotelmatobacter sp.]|nr:hypothetical protein [Candidatus Sulfotelmatobacter sp.]
MWRPTRRLRVQVGSANAYGLLTAAFMSGKGRWLAIQIGSELEQLRALQIAVPYAMKAADAEKLGGFPRSAFVLSASAGRSAPGSAKMDGSITSASRGPVSDSGPSSIPIAGGTWLQIVRKCPTQLPSRM